MKNLMVSAINFFGPLYGVNFQPLRLISFDGRVVNSDVIACKSIHFGLSTVTLTTTRNGRSSEASQSC